MSSWEVGWENEQPYIPIEMGGVAVAGTRENLYLYTFSPQYTEIDHAYLVQDEKKKRVGYYMFRLAVPEFEQLVELMDEHYFWHARGLKPSEADIKAYAKYAAQDEERPPWLD